MVPEILADDLNLSLKLFVVLNKASKVITERALKDMKKYGLSPTQFTVLELLYHKGEVPLQQIGNKILMTSGSITYNIDKLEERGLIKRVPCNNDRRVVYALLTDEGRQLMDELFPVHAQSIQEMMSILTVQEKSTLIPLIKKLGKSVHQI